MCRIKVALTLIVTMKFSVLRVCLHCAWIWCCTSFLWRSFKCHPTDDKYSTVRMKCTFFDEFGAILWNENPFDFHKKTTNSSFLMLAHTQTMFFRNKIMDGMSFTKAIFNRYLVSVWNGSCFAFCLHHKVHLAFSICMILLSLASLSLASLHVAHKMRFRTFGATSTSLSLQLFSLFSVIVNLFNYYSLVQLPFIVFHLDCSFVGWGGWAHRTNAVAVVFEVRMYTIFNGIIMTQRKANTAYESTQHEHHFTQNEWTKKQGKQKRK